MVQILSTVYNLNKSATKNIIIGLEYDNDVEKCIPKARLIGKDFTGVPFERCEWASFVSSMKHADKYFDSYPKYQDLKDSKILGINFTMRFTSTHGELAIEIEESDMSENASGPEIKKFKHSIIYKKSTFLGLQKILPCIEERFNYLEKIAPVFETVIDNIATTYYKLGKFDEKNYASMAKLSDLGLIVNDKEILEVITAVKETGLKSCECSDLMKVIYTDALLVAMDYVVYKINTMVLVPSERPKDLTNNSATSSAGPAVIDVESEAEDTPVEEKKD